MKAIGGLVKGHYAIHNPSVITLLPITIVTLRQLTADLISWRRDRLVRLGQTPWVGPIGPIGPI